MDISAVISSEELPCSVRLISSGWVGYFHVILEDPESGDLHYTHDFMSIEEIEEKLPEIKIKEIILKDLKAVLNEALEKQCRRCRYYVNEKGGLELCTSGTKRVACEVIIKRALKDDIKAARFCLSFAESDISY